MAKKSLTEKTKVKKNKVDEGKKPGIAKDSLKLAFCQGRLEGYREALKDTREAEGCKDYKLGYIDGKTDGIKLIVTNAEGIMKQHQVEHPPFWIATLVKCFREE